MVIQNLQQWMDAEKVRLQKQFDLEYERKLQRLNTGLGEKIMAELQPVTDLMGEAAGDRGETMEKIRSLLEKTIREMIA
ncbi:MAG: hypothetical protein HQL52_11270 [Magnetococcales bacterium]|nr:hypothetical protein [Magnetococcales bacterium]